MGSEDVVPPTADSPGGEVHSAAVENGTSDPGVLKDATSCAASEQQAPEQKLELLPIPPAQGESTGPSVNISEKSSPAESRPELDSVPMDGVTLANGEAAKEASVKEEDRLPDGTPLVEAATPSEAARAEPPSTATPLGDSEAAPVEEEAQASKTEEQTPAPKVEEAVPAPKVEESAPAPAPEGGAATADPAPAEPGEKSKEEEAPSLDGPSLAEAGPAVSFQSNSDLMLEERRVQLEEVNEKIEEHEAQLKKLRRKQYKHAFSEILVEPTRLVVYREMAPKQRPPNVDVQRAPPSMAPDATMSPTPSAKSTAEQADEDEELARRTRRFWRAFYTVLLVITSVGNTVCFKQMTSAMPNYGWYLTQLSSVAYVPIFGILAKQKSEIMTDRQLLQRFAVMGLFDGLSGILTVLGGIHTSGTLQVLIGQLVIPSTLLLSIIFLGKRFHVLQYVGAAGIVTGIVLATALSGQDQGDNNALFVALFAMAVLPAALSSIFKEVAFKGFDGDLDVNVIQFWVAVFQVGVNFLAMPIYSLKALGPQQVPLENMLSQVEGGTRCLFFAEDSITTNCGMPGQRPCDACGTAWQPVYRYLFFNFLFNICSMLVIKYGSAALSFLVATLRMPLSSVAFSSQIVMGASATSLHISDLSALVVILGGLAAYRYGSRLLKRQRRKEEAGPLQTPASPRGSWLWSPTPSEATSAAVAKPKGPHYEPVFSLGVPGVEPVFVLVPAHASPVPAPRSADRARMDLIRRLGAANIMDSPQFRQPLLPSPPSEDDDDVNFSMEGLPPEQHAPGRR